ncbi:hypothetical protein [Streptomyces sp. Y1]|uniref:Uncharacterized protein n=1 Tax=Streptomyces sp. Y1 TaxID=3238634 RepID=A0AB39TEW0_9ACTN
MAIRPPPPDGPRDGDVISASPLEAAPRAIALLRAARAELDEVLREYRDGLTEVYRLQTMPGWRGTGHRPTEGVNSFLGPIRNEERRSKRMTELLFNGGTLPLKQDGEIDFGAIERGEF